MGKCEYSQCDLQQVAQYFFTMKLQTGNKDFVSKS